MHPIIVLAIIVLSFWSVITSFIAIFKILTNNFKGDKLTWIAISMIGIIGPILWLCRGRKLITKKY